MLKTSLYLALLARTSLLDAKAPPPACPRKFCGFPPRVHYYGLALVGSLLSFLQAYRGSLVRGVMGDGCLGISLDLSPNIILDFIHDLPPQELTILFSEAFLLVVGAVRVGPLVPVAPALDRSSSQSCMFMFVYVHLAELPSSPLLSPVPFFPGSFSLGHLL